MRQRFHPSQAKKQRISESIVQIRSDAHGTMPHTLRLVAIEGIQSQFVVNVTRRVFETFVLRRLATILRPNTVRGILELKVYHVTPRREVE